MHCHVITLDYRLNNFYLQVRRLRTLANLNYRSNKLRTVQRAVVSVRNMSSVSKTGLIASPKKKIHRRKQTTDVLNLSKCAIAKPVQFSLRPFGGLFNPYSKGCSILCNHPGPNEVKDVVKQVKETWISEGKGHFYREDNHGRNEVDVFDSDIQEHIPEEFFRRYTGSDSRPLTPTPTVASGRTRTSAGSHINARRCFTPDPVNSMAKERKQLILDLRRSHSQETLFWNASSELTPSVQNQEKPQQADPPPKNQRLCEIEARKKSAEKKAQQAKLEAEAKANQIECINDQDEVEDEGDEPRRRGKRKSKKTKMPTTTTFQVSQEPETQIATLGPDDSPNPSGRPSLIPNEQRIPRLSLLMKGQSNDSREEYLKSSFISEEALKFLRCGLNIDVVESNFERYMSKALQEAFRTIPPEKLEYESEALRKFKETIDITEVDNEKWLKMPRKYTRQSARFGLTVNTYELATMTPFQYISKHVWISEHRKQHYRFVFKKFLPEPLEEAQDKPTQPNPEHIADVPPPKPNYEERTISFVDVRNALSDALGFYGTPEKINEILDILCMNEQDHKVLNFRSWCGVIAFSERYLNKLSHEEDPRDEVEIIDFESLERKFSYVNVSDELKQVLYLVKSDRPSKLVEN